VPIPVTFLGGESGAWRVTRIDAVVGAALPSVARLEMVEGPFPGSTPAAWVLRGVTSNQRYTTAGEQTALAATQAPLGRPGATRAALIPITKSERWWALSQDQRREVVEETSHHIAIGLEYLPTVARRLHHGRDLGEPFDFLTWFEFPPEGADAFEALVDRLRSTPEWDFVEREIDIRLDR